MILNYVEFGHGEIKKTLAGNKTVLCNYHIGSGFLVSCNSSYKTVSIQPWKSATGKTYPTDEEISPNFQMWEELITECQKMFIECKEIYTCEPCILSSEDKPGHNAMKYQEYFNFGSELI